MIFLTLQIKEPKYIVNHKVKFFNLEDSESMAAKQTAKQTPCRICSNEWGGLSGLLRDDDGIEIKRK